VWLAQFSLLAYPAVIANVGVGQFLDSMLKFLIPPVTWPFTARRSILSTDFSGSTSNFESAALGVGQFVA
jgi:hypothetical protein